ncbi:MAG TPA: DUF3189 family protein [Firmicutes bacterium]|nr:DUF3189 family protein [Bacillota bacterium]
MRNKKIIYHWSGRGVSAPLAAALHLGLVEPTPAGTAARKIARSLVGGIPFGRGAGKEKGTLIFLGTGKSGEKVYLLPRGKEGKLLLTLIQETARLLGEDPDTYYFIDCELCTSRQPASRKGKELFRRIEEMVLAVKEDARACAALPGP